MDGKAGKAAIDYSFHMNLTHFDEQVEKDIPSLVEMGITTCQNSFANLTS